MSEELTTEEIWKAGYTIRDLRAKNAKLLTANIRLCEALLKTIDAARVALKEPDDE